MEQVFQLMLAGVGLIISYVVWHSSARTARAQYHQSMQAAWNVYNQAALASKENLEVAEWLFSWNEKPPAASSAMQRRYLAFMSINAIQAAFHGMMDGVMSASYADRNFEQLLPPLVWKDEIFQLTQYRGYDRRFALLCAELRKYLEDPEGSDPKTKKKFKSYSLPPIDGRLSLPDETTRGKQQK